MTTIRLNVITTIRPVINVNRYAEQNKPIILNTAARRLSRWQQNRFISFSAGGGDWAKLAASTILRKTRRGVASNPEWILREYDELFTSFGFRNINGALVVGITNNKSHPRGSTTFVIARVHQGGLGRVPVRRIVILPPKGILKQMNSDIRAEYNKIIRRNRRAR